jgi:hypothetical protein
VTLRRTLAVAVAAAVTTPVALIAATPAFADAKPPAQTENRPTYAELKEAADDAQQAYEEAVATEQKELQDVEATGSDTYPLKAAWLAAEKAAQEAAAAETAAEKAVADAEAELEEAESEADRAEARKALDLAEAKLAKAVRAVEKADAEAEAANTAWHDARVQEVREYDVAKKALAAATKAEEAAAEALAAAEECVREPGLTTLAHGLPSKIVAGSTVDFTLRVTNGTDRTLNVDPLVLFHEHEYHSLRTQWFDGSSWQALTDQGSQYLNTVESMQPGSHSDVKMRLAVDSKAGQADALALLAGDASGVYNPCVRGPMKRYDFQVLPADSEPGEVDDAEPGEPDKGDDKRPDTAQPDSSKEGTSVQGGSSEEEEEATDGKLATTGTSSAPGSIALASTAAVALGAGAIFVVRRRRADHG